MRRTPSSSTLRASVDDLGVAVDVSQRRVEADVHEPLARVLERQAAALGELGGERLDAAGDDAREDAGRALGEREVRHRRRR